MKAAWCSVLVFISCGSLMASADTATLLVKTKDGLAAWQLVLTEETNYKGTHEIVKLSQVDPQGAIKWVTNTKPRKPLPLIANIAKTEKLSRDLQKKPLAGQVEKTVWDTDDYKIQLITDKNGLHCMKLLTLGVTAWGTAVLTMDEAASLREVLTDLDKHVAELRKVQALGK